MALLLRKVFRLRIWTQMFYTFPDIYVTHVKEAMLLYFTLFRDILIDLQPVSFSQYVAVTAHVGSFQGQFYCQFKSHKTPSQCY